MDERSDLQNGSSSESNSSYFNNVGNGSFFNISSDARNSSYFNNVCLKDHKSLDGVHGISTCPFVAYDVSIFRNTITTEVSLEGKLVFPNLNFEVQENSYKFRN